MIRVECGACGAAFKARDEHAGRRGKCPRCGEPVEVPEAGAPGPSPAAGGASDARAGRAGEPLAVRAAGGAPEPLDAPAGGEAPESLDAPHTASARRVSAGRRRARGRAAVTAGAELGSVGSRRRRIQRSGMPGWLLPTAIGVVAVVAAFVAYRSMLSDVTVSGDATAFRLGREALNRGEFIEARKQFAAVTPGTTMYAEAQRRLVELDERIASAERGQMEQDAERAFANVLKLEKAWVDDPSDPNYAGNCRYMLKRAREFLEEFPGAKQVPQAEALFTRYANVASLDEPPSTIDVRREIYFRKAAKQWATALEVIAEFAPQPQAHPSVVEELEREVRAAAEADWKEVEKGLRATALRPGQENWHEVRSRTREYLARVRGDWALSQPAQELLTRAESELGS